MPLARASIIRGPGLVALASAVFYSRDVQANTELARFQIAPDVFGEVDNRIDDVMAKILFTPEGELENLATLYPHQSPVIGASLFGASDTEAYVHSLAGKKVTFHAAALTRMPELILSANKTLFGQAEITCIRKNNTAASAAASLFTIATTALSDTSFTTAGVKTQHYAAAWGTVLTSILTEGGWRITPEMRVRFHQSDEVGTVDATLEGVSVLAKCRPLNLAESDILDALRLQNSASAVRGTTLRRGENLVLTGTGFTVTLHDAALVEGPLRWGRAELRAGEIGFISHRAESSGAFTNLFTLATS